MAEQSQDIALTPQATLAALNAQYALHFASQPRATRDLRILDHLIDSADGLLQTPKLDPADAAEIEAALQAFRAERRAVESAKATQGAAALSLWQSRLGFVMHRFARHFAGKPRTTRDLSLLDEMVHDVEELAAQLHSLSDVAPADRQQAKATAQGHRAFLKAERQAIEAALTKESAARQSGLLGACANAQFTDMERWTGQTPGVLLRPQWLRRKQRELVRLLDAMTALDGQPGVPETNAENQRIVATQLEGWENLLAQLRDMRESVAVDTLVMQLGQRVEQVLDAFQDYAQHNEISPLMLAEICDGVDEIERQLTALVASMDPPEEAHNQVLSLARDALMTFQRLFDEATAAGAQE